MMARPSFPEAVSLSVSAVTLQDVLAELMYEMVNERSLLTEMTQRTLKPAARELDVVVLLDEVLLPTHAACVRSFVDRASYS
jgi:hypothetical protein